MPFPFASGHLASQNHVVRRRLEWKKISERPLVKTSTWLVLGATIGCAVFQTKEYSKPE